MLEALATLLVFQTVGEVLSYGLRLPVPGPVIGMALLLGVLLMRPITVERLRPTSLELLKHLSLLFVPAGVGVMLHVARIGKSNVLAGLERPVVSPDHPGGVGERLAQESRLPRPIVHANLDA